MPNYLEQLLTLERNTALTNNISGYRSDEEVISDFIRIQRKASAIGYMTLQPRNVVDAFTVYARAGRPSLGFLLLGRNALGEKANWLSTLQYPLIDDTVFENFEVLNQFYNMRGSILNSPIWSFYMNDMFISGAVANRIPFYLASNRNFSTLWEAGTTHPSVFSRELAGLFMAGYELSRHQGGSEVLTPPAHRTTELRISKYMKALPAYSTPGTVAEMGNPNLLKMLYNTRSNKVISVRAAR